MSFYRLLMFVHTPCIWFLVVHTVLTRRKYFYSYMYTKHISATSCCVSVYSCSSNLILLLNIFVYFIFSFLVLCMCVAHLSLFVPGFYTSSKFLFLSFWVSFFLFYMYTKVLLFSVRRRRFVLKFVIHFMCMNVCGFVCFIPLLPLQLSSLSRYTQRFLLSLVVFVLKSLVHFLALNSILFYSSCVAQISYIGFASKKKLILFSSLFIIRFQLLKLTFAYAHIK